MTEVPEREDPTATAIEQDVPEIDPLRHPLSIGEFVGFRAPIDPTDPPDERQGNADRTVETCVDDAFPTEDSGVGWKAYGQESVIAGRDVTDQHSEDALRSLGTNPTRKKPNFLPGCRLIALSTTRTSSLPTR